MQLASINRHDKWTNSSQQMFRVFAFGFNMHIKTLLPLINSLIGDALLDSQLC